MSKINKLSPIINSLIHQTIPFQDLLIVDKSGIPHYRFFLVEEINKSSLGEHQLAMANVISNLDQRNSSFVYLLSGTDTGIKLYLGVSSFENIDVDQKILKNAFEGNFIGSKLNQNVFNDAPELVHIFDKTQYIGLVTGVPSFNEKDPQLEEDNFQGMERLVNTMNGSNWHILIVAEPGSEAEILTAINDIQKQSSELSGLIKLSTQHNQSLGESFSVNQGASRTLTQGISESETEGTSYSESLGSTVTQTKSKTINLGKSLSKMFSKTRGGSDTEGTNTPRGKKNSPTDTSSYSTNWGSSHSTTDGISSSFSDQESKSVAKSKTKTKGWNSSKTIGSSFSDAQGATEGYTQGSTKNMGVSYTREKTNKSYEQIQNHLDEYQIPRFLQGLNKGMFKTAIYICAESEETYSRLSGSVKSIFQGNEATLSPLNVMGLPYKNLSLGKLLSLKRLPAKLSNHSNRTSALIHSIPISYNRQLLGATWLNTKELSLVAGLPSKELPGLRLRKSVSFATNISIPRSVNELNMGKIIQDGRILEKNDLTLDRSDLNKHIFVTGVTGSGKTTTCMKLLLSSGLPFVVIEPAKTEYRALYAQDSDIQYYALGREDLSTFRLNPFELISRSQSLMGHISMLKATMTAVFPMDGSMPFIVEQAIIKAYEDKGWDIVNSINYFADDTNNDFRDSHRDLWPTFSDMINALDGVIKSAGMGQDFTEKYQGSLVSRLSALTKGIKGAMINVTHSMDFSSLLDKRIVIELDELKDEEDKAFFMALIIGRFAEAMKYRHRLDPNFRHITLIEEAHRLLSKPEAGEDNSKKMGVEMFANLLAEVRKYGESLIIADQIPNKLISDVIKNTNTKIIHRLFSADDRDVMGDAIGLDQDQKDFLPMLQAGEVVVYSGGWHAPIRAQIDHLVNTTGKEIDNDLIKAKGQVQLWEQKSVLFPNVSQCNYLSNAVDFALFIRKGRMILELWQRIGYLLKLEDKKNTAIGVIDQKVKQWVKDLQNHLCLKSEELAQLLAGLLFDISVSQLFYSDYRQYYAQVITKIVESDLSMRELSVKEPIIIGEFLKKFLDVI